MMMGMGMNPMMMGLMIGMQMLQMMQMMQMMQGQQQGGCGCGGGFPGGGMPMGDVFGQGMGFPPMMSPPMQFPGYAPPFGGPSPWGGGGFPSPQPPSYGGPQGPWSNAPMARPGDFGGSGMGNAIARSADRVASTMGTSGYCYRGVKAALRPFGVNLTGGSAYMAADQLANNPRFREIQVSREQLRSLPPGAVVVWNRGPGRPHGHISISLGGGREASDRHRRQITNYPSTFRVFIPNDNGGGAQQRPNRPQYA